MIGFVLVDKPPGPTSHDVVASVRRVLTTRKVGHAGTLDPPASGLVVLGVGAATRLLRYVQGQPKRYTATGVLGVRTTTLDAAGATISSDPVESDESRLREVLSRFVGEIQQVPPAVSAVKVGGERAYRRAARGEDVEMAARTVTVHSLHLVSFEPPRFSIQMECSTGTYVRSLVADVGEALGCGAHVSELRRTAIGSLDVTEAVPPSEVTVDRLIGVAEALRDMPQVEIGPEDAISAGHGRPLEMVAAAGEVLVRGPEGVVGVFASADGILRPVTVLPPEPRD